MARAGTWGAVGWAATLLFQITLGALIFRTAGSAAFGVWSLLIVGRALLLLPASGLAMSIARDEARLGHHDGAGSRRTAALLLACAGAAVSLAIGTVLVPVPAKLFDAQDVSGVELATFLVGIEAALAFLATGLGGILRGRNQFGALAAGQTAQAVVGLAIAIALVPSQGLPGAAVASILGRIAVLAITAVALRGGVAGLVGPSAAGVRGVLAFASPLWLIAIGSQLGLSTDIPIVGTVFGADVAGLYGAGTAVTAAAAALLFAVIDVSFHRLSTSAGEASQQFTRWLVLTAALLAGLGFGLLAVLSEDVLQVWIGEADPLAVTVLIIYSAVWAINAPVHALVLRAMADGRHAVLVPVVGAEALACFALSVLLAITIGPVGPAFATLATIAVSNGLVVPRLLVGPGALDRNDYYRRTFGGLAAGAAMSLVIGGPLVVLGVPPVASLAIASVLAAAIGVSLLRRRGSLRHELRRIVGLVRYGGWRLLVRERNERRDVGSVLETYRTQHVWLPGEEPLVTVRIATYNRGPIVAERAIASALDQSHRNLEVVVVGDHCDPVTEAAVLAVKDPRVRFENLPARGRYPDRPTHRWMVAGAAPMNRALEIARGDWIAPLDDDDEFTGDHVEKLLDACRAGDLEFSYGIALMEMHPGEWREVGSWPLQSGQIIHAAVLYTSALRLMRHEFDSWRIDEPGDWNLWRRMEAAGVRMGFVDEVVCKHYMEARHNRPAPAGNGAA